MATKEKNFRRQKYLKSKIKNGNTFSKVVGTEILFISIKKLNEIENIYDRILVLFFFKRSSTLKASTLRRERLGFDQPFFTLWKIRAVSPIKERREIDTVSDTCSIGPQKYRELHERFGARCVQNRRSNKKKERKKERERRVRGVRYIWIARKCRTRRKGLRKAAETIRSNWIIYWPRQ